MLFGFLNIDKPLGMTSHDAVVQVRRAAKVRSGRAVKVGHAGTLDPLATGVLIVCMGAATRLSEYVMASTKHYRAEVELGVMTTTYDAEGEVVARVDASHITAARVEAALPAFLGEIAQLPPMYSAVKQDGRRLYELARSGQIVEREARHVHIESISLTHWTPPRLTLEVVCGAGTYIRSLAHDLGQALGVGGYLTGLVRTASGGFSLRDALSLPDLLTTEDWTPLLTSPQAALADWPVVQLDMAAWEHVRHGRAIPTEFPVAEGVLARADTPHGRIGAVLQARSGWWHPHKVF